MQTFNVKMSLVRGNKLCVAIKSKLIDTDGIKLLQEPDVWKQKKIEMNYNLTIDNRVFQIQEFAGCIRPAQVINPLLDLIMQVLKEKGVAHLPPAWGSHIPTLGMLPIVYLFWLDVGVTIYIKK